MSGFIPKAEWHIDHNIDYDVHWYGWYDEKGQQFHHKEDGPSKVIKYTAAHLIEKFGEIACEVYAINSLCHRIDGYAIINYAPAYSNQYMLFGYPISEKDFNTPGFVDAFILEHS